MFCNKCGNKIEDDENFCDKCGNKITKNKDKNYLKLVIDLICYIIGVPIFLFFFLMLITTKDIIGLFGMLIGLSIIPLVYNLILSNTKIKQCIIIISRITIPFLIFFISIIATIDYSSINKLHKQNDYKTIVLGESNPWKVTQDYNGIYSFKYSNNVVIEGAIDIKNDSVNMSYSITSGSVANMTNKKGFCGINENDNSFNILLKSDDNKHNSIYTCKKQNNNLICENKSLYDFNGSLFKSELVLKRTNKSFQEIAKSIKQKMKKKIEKEEKNEKSIKEIDKEIAEYDKKQKIEKKKKNSSVMHKVGETVICPNFEIKVKKFKIKKRGTRIDSFSTVDDPEWIGVILKVKNIGKYTYTFYTSDVTLKNSTGEIIEPEIWNYNIWGVEMLDSPTLVPQGRKTGYIAFANTNKNNKNLVLLISCNENLIVEDTIYKFSLK